MTKHAMTPYEPTDLASGYKLAKGISNSGLVPTALRGKPDDVLVVMMTGRELGLTAMASLRGIHVVKGKAVLSADLMVGLCVRHPECSYFRCVESTDNIATYETLREGHPEPTRLSWTAEQAKKAGLSGDNWRKYPDAMLRARCSSALARIVYPDLTAGVYELSEFDLTSPPAPAKVDAVERAGRAVVAEEFGADPETGVIPNVEHQCVDCGAPSLTVPRCPACESAHGDDDVPAALGGAA